MRRLLGIIRSQIRYKIILPYLALTLLVTMAGAAIALGLVAASWEERLSNQLAQVARNTSDALVRRERNHLDFLRWIAFAPANPSTGAPAMASAFASGEEEQVDRALDPFYRYGVGNVNLDFDRLIAFDSRGRALIDWQRVGDNPDAPPLRLQGTDFSQVEVVRKIVSGATVDGDDKFSNLIYFAPDPQPYFYTAVPIRQGDRVVGGVMIAMKIDRLLAWLGRSTQATVTSFYDLQGNAISSALGTSPLPRTELATVKMPQEALKPLLEGQAQSIFDVDIRERPYELAYSPLVIANRQVGYFSVGLSRDFQVDQLSLSRNTIIALAMALALGSVLIGYRIARGITRPLAALVETAEAVTAGDFERRTEIASTDELGRLSRAFNQMTEHLLRLYRTSRELSSAIEVEPVLEVAARTVGAFVPGTVVLALLDQRGTWAYQIPQAAGPEFDALRYLRLAPSDPFLRDLAQSRDVRLINPAEEPRLAAMGLADIAGFQSVLLAPLVVQEELAGVLIFGHTQPDLFDDAIEPTLVSIANMTASVLYNALLFDRVHAEASERQAILQSIADGVIVCDQQRTITLVNNAAEEMLQLHDWHFVRRNFNQVPFRRVEVSQELFGRDQPDIEHYQLGNRVMRMSSAPVIGEDGNVLGEVIVLHDISAEAAVDQAKTDFIATISHELRSPLTVISGYNDLLLRGMAGELSADQREMLEQIRARVEHMNSLVKNVIMVASIEANTLSLAIEPQDLWVAVENVASTMRAGFARKGLDLRIELPEDLPHVMADREHLKLILTQLLDNARRYTQAGSVAVSATWRNNMVQIDVSDTGPGIPSEEFSKLFTRFHRIEGNSSPERGSGLGLAITRQLVERQGGQVWAYSEVGRGSTFSFALPIATEHATSALDEQPHTDTRA